MKIDVKRAQAWSNKLGKLVDEGMKDGMRAPEMCALLMVHSRMMETALRESYPNADALLEAIAKYADDMDKMSRYHLHVQERAR